MKVRLSGWLRVRLSTALVAMLTASALVGINAKPFAFYYPRPPWIEELTMFALPGVDSAIQQWGPYGWPAPAYPSWNWCGNGVPNGEYPQWANFWNPGDAHIACNWPQWNTRALAVDAVANVIVFMMVMGTWWLLGLVQIKKIFASRNTSAPSRVQ